MINSRPTAPLCATGSYVSTVVVSGQPADGKPRFAQSVKIDGSGRGAAGHDDHEAVLHGEVVLLPPHLAERRGASAQRFNGGGSRSARSARSAAGSLRP